MTLVLWDCVALGCMAALLSTWHAVNLAQSRPAWTLVLLNSWLWLRLFLRLFLRLRFAVCRHAANPMRFYR
eukprot:COSAG04_NODE_9631_length_846_cov_0.987952_3_plen_70_part_01